MKYPNFVLSNDIVQDFDKVRLSVKTDKQVLIFGIRIVLIKETIVFGSIKRHSDIGLVHPMLESGRVEHYGNIHISSL
ncbi:MAG: hypothetical protein LBL64_07240 [Treponema sp.]|nr:hypothetical protein [Treponema sp.]